MFDVTNIKNLALCKRSDSGVIYLDSRIVCMVLLQRSCWFYSRFCDTVPRSQVQAAPLQEATSLAS